MALCEKAVLKNLITFIWDTCDGVLILVKSQAQTCKLTENSTTFPEFNYEFYEIF